MLHTQRVQTCCATADSLDISSVGSNEIVDQVYEHAVLNGGAHLMILLVIGSEANMSINRSVRNCDTNQAASTVIIFMLADT